MRVTDQESLSYFLSVTNVRCYYLLDAIDLLDVWSCYVKLSSYKCRVLYLNTSGLEEDIELYSEIVTIATFLTLTPMMMTSEPAIKTEIMMIMIPILSQVC